MQFRVLLVCLFVFTTNHVVKTEDCSASEVTIVTDSMVTESVKTETSENIVLGEISQHEELISNAEGTVKIDETETNIPESGQICDQVIIDKMTKEGDAKKHEIVEIDAINGVEVNEKHDVRYESSSKSSAESKSVSLETDVENQKEGAKECSCDKREESEAEEEIHDEQVKGVSTVTEVQESSTTTEEQVIETGSAVEQQTGSCSKPVVEAEKVEVIINKVTEDSAEDTATVPKHWWEQVWTQVFPDKKMEKVVVNKCA